MITHETEVTIDAPPDVVWKHLVDFDRHRDWSRSFKLQGRAVVGERGRVEFPLFGRAARWPVWIDRVDREQELRWRGGPAGVMTGSHYFALQGIDGGRKTRLRHGETFSGVLAPLLWPFLKSGLGPSYGRFNEDLKRRVEHG